MSSTSRRILIVLAALLPLGGCHHFNHALPFFGSAPPALENPVFVPAGDPEFIWNQVVDTVDDYFKIAREDRVRVVGGVLTEGRIHTHPTPAATLLEPWRRDSVGSYERLHSTLQTLRRRAEIRVVPMADGYSIEVAVLKELEDVSRPEHATVGGSTIRHDGSLVRGETTPDGSPVTLGWISQGRDFNLEQRMLAELRGRLGV